ncbi:pantoate--beta-alanine ligase [Streptomyces sp. NRRL B-24484]|uniref:pantoate--beta-alanine ligase n=1 Tax=Streptomyces sp. NRRL B-24484 TaxID=1463833 RepID=UPI0004BF065D|nr:pantoate--beta-alanine ligase [Streptomyces sp. NRRL B-24484]
MARGKQPAKAKAPRTTALTRTVEEFEAAFWPDDQPVDNAVVMTMGALHAGHAALIRAARRQVGRDGRVAVTVFVNPLQFGAGEDLDRYPRTLDDDLEVAREAGADVVFAPTVEEMYPNGEPLVRLSAGPMGEGFEGASRPGHFDGMLTVVAKLLHITDPDFALFGEKDAQQLAIVRRMVADLDFDVEIVGVPTVREEDGLALSSRNRFLSDTERSRALALSRALFAGRDAGAQGAKAVREAAAAVLDGADGVTPDYLALIDPNSFTEVPDDFTGEALLAVAATVGPARLIDNVGVIVR